MRMTSGPRTLLRLLAAAVTAGLLTAGPVGTSLTVAPAHADSHDSRARRLVAHTVRPGETVTALAVRYHAWTDELIARNHLDRSGHLRVGQHLVVPVVLAALPRHRAHRGSDDPSRATVRRVVARTARHRGVDPQLALAVAWQESGWQMDRRSSAGALGAMQVLPGTAAWMSLYEGRRLHPHRLVDNALAGVRLLRVLGEETATRRRQVAAYHQGLGVLRSDGIYAESRPYVRSVLAIERRLEAGRAPA